jgi:hypothetical protein
MQRSTISVGKAFSKNSQTGSGRDIFCNKTLGSRGTGWDAGSIRHDDKWEVGYEASRKGHNPIDVIHDSLTEYIKTGKLPPLPEAVASDR